MVPEAGRVAVLGNRQTPRGWDRVRCSAGGARGQVRGMAWVARVRASRERGASVCAGPGRSDRALRAPRATRATRRAQAAASGGMPAGASCSDRQARGWTGWRIRCAACTCALEDVRACMQRRGLWRLRPASARAECAAPHTEVAWSCKHRGFCPSCCGRARGQTAQVAGRHRDRNARPSLAPGATRRVDAAGRSPLPRSPAFARTRYGSLAPLRDVTARFFQPQARS